MPVKTGNKYHPLYRALEAAGTGNVSLTFGEIEALLGRPLPPSARSRRDWWGNRNKANQASAWMEAGYHVVELDLPGERVTFARPVRTYHIRREGDTILWDSDLIKGLRQYLGLSQAQFAEQLGVRQQTISEWETGMYAPSRATRKYLTLVAEQAGFSYGEGEGKPDFTAYSNEKK
jgi:DNA-binding XRE family transcriptional regulator